jgi:Aspartyl protease
MKRLFSPGRIHLIIAISLANFGLPVLQSESRCPGSAASVTPRLIQRALIVIPVKINQTGPYDFVVDTGSQVTLIDPSLALELGLKPRGNVGLISVLNFARASVTVLDRLEAGSKVVAQPLAIVNDIGEIRSADARIKGVLGENFLAHFDLLIDYAHKRLCLDETSALRNSVRGEHIPLVIPEDHESELPFMERLVISVHLSGAGNREILLQLDSGSNGSLLYPAPRGRELRILDRASPRGTSVSKAQQAFADLPPQDVRIGSRTLGHVSFATPVHPGDVPSRQEDGLLPTLLFQRVFISSSGHYAVFDLW